MSPPPPPQCMFCLPPSLPPLCSLLRPLSFVGNTFLIRDVPGIALDPDLSPHPPTFLPNTIVNCMSYRRNHQLSFSRRKRSAHCTSSKGYYDDCFEDGEEKEPIFPPQAFSIYRPSETIEYDESELSLFLRLKLHLHVCSVRQKESY